MVEGTGLENRQAGDRLVGSNPTPSASGAGPAAPENVAFYDQAEINLSMTQCGIRKCGIRKPGRAVVTNDNLRCRLEWLSRCASYLHVSYTRKWPIVSQMLLLPNISILQLLQQA